MTGDTGLGAGMSNAHPHPDKAFTAKRIHYGFDPVVPSGSPVLNNFKHPERQIHIIMDDNDIVNRNFEIGGYFLEGEPAPIHIGKGFDQKHVLAVKRCPGVIGVKPGFVELSISLFCNGLNHQKTDVMAGPGIGFARVSQTRYQFKARG